MATLLKDIAVGSLVKLNEDGVPTEFYVAKHDYEAELNGTGRTLFVRKDAYGKKQWNSSGVNQYQTGTIDTWLNGEYLTFMDASVQNRIGTTNFFYTDKTNDSAVSTLARSIFLLSMTELGMTSTIGNVEGATLPIASDLKVAYCNGTAVSQWTRTPVTNRTDNVVLVSNTGSLATNTGASYSEIYVRPVFTLPTDDCFVLDDGTMVFDVPTISGEDADLGEKSSVVTVEYSVTTLTGNTATVTELVSDTIIRTYTATSGDTQTATVNLSKYIDGTYTINITAEAEGVTAERNYTFTVPALTLHDGGTAQEFQDENGDPVFPATLAKAVLTESGKSVERKLSDINDKINNDGVYKIGDTLATIRTDLSDDWLLCNGELIRRDEYSKLGDLDDRFISQQILKDSGITLADTEFMLCYNGLWVINNGNYVFTTTDPTRTWTLNENKITTKMTWLKNLYCYNGTWVGVGSMSSGSTLYPYITTTNDPTGTWTELQIYSANCILKNIYCYNDTWVAVGTSGSGSSGSMLMFTTTNLIGEWTKVSGTFASGKNPCVYCYNGIWVATPGYGNPYIYTTTDPTGTWTMSEISTASTGIVDICCYNGLWVAVGTNGYVFTTTDPTGTWTEQVISSNDLNRVFCHNGIWVISGNSCEMFTTTDLANGWGKIEIIDLDGSSPPLYDLGYYDGILMAIGSAGSTSNKSIYMVSNSHLMLPIITNNDVYTYIKAKEVEQL